MAITGTTNKKYYKIDYNNCYVAHNTVYVRYLIYLTESERLKEKSRYTAIEDFKKKFTSYLDEKQTELASKIQAADIQSKEQLVASDLLAEYNLVKDLDNVYQNLDDLLWNKNNIKKVSLDIRAEVLLILYDLGLEQQWLNDPIVFYDGGITHCGAYRKEPISYKLYYDRLKELVPEATIDN
jgi:hypothetical protein